MRLTRRGRNLRDVALATLLTIPLAFAASLDAEAAPLPVQEPVQVAQEWAKPKPEWKCRDWAAKILHEAGFRGERHRQAWAITWRESKHQNLGPDSPWFSGALGLWQVQTSAHSGKSWWSYGAMMDPVAQSKIVYRHMSDKGRNWQAWGLTPSGQLDTTQYGGWSSWQHLNWILYPYQKGYALYPCKTTPPKN